MKAFQQNLSKLEGANTQVLGVSMDSPFSNYEFAKSMGVSFPLLGDFGGQVTKEYGLAKQYDIQGAKITSARRATFVIDETGKITHIQTDNEAVDPTKTIDACAARRLKE